MVQVTRDTRLVGHVVRGAVGLGGGGSHPTLDVGRVLTERVGEAEVGDGLVVAVGVGSAEVRVHPQGPEAGGHRRPGLAGAGGQSGRESRHRRRRHCAANRATGRHGHGHGHGTFHDL